MNRFDYIKRLSEPSTWAGIGVVLGLFGMNMDPGQAHQFVAGGTGLAGLLAVFLREKRGK